MTKTGKLKEKKHAQFGSVCIQIGKEEKEVQNLQLRTTVNEVISALVKDNEDEAGSEIKNWVIVESWRGIERPLPPKTRLLKVWNSWKNEQRFVRFYLKKSSSIAFRHNQPSKSLRNRRKRPNFIGAQETFIDGPLQDESSAAVSESTSGTTTSGETTTSGDTFGSPSELSMTTSATTTTTSESTGSESDIHSKDQDKSLRELVANCVAAKERIDQMSRTEMKVKAEIDLLERVLEEATIRAELADLTDQVNLVEERISSLNNVSAGIQMNIVSVKQKKGNQEEEEIARSIQTKIEAHLYVNLQLAAESDTIAEELAHLEQSINARMDLFDEDRFEESSELEDQILSYVLSQQDTMCGDSECRSCPDCMMSNSCSSDNDEIRQRKTSSITASSTTTSGICSATSFESNFPEDPGVTKVVSFESDLPDSDSAVSSISSSEFERMNKKASDNDIISKKTDDDNKNISKYVRETLV